MNTGRKISIMGIVNLTDDSYFAESRCADVEAALDRVACMVAEGADIIDIGACSTRPGSVPVGEEEEWRRLEPVLRALRKRFPHVLFSIDTCFSSVVCKAYDILGRFIVNDISAGEADPAMLSTVGGLKLPYVAMHMRGTPQTMQALTDYKDVVSEVLEYFRFFSEKASENGIDEWILDPGFGFAKTIEQNYNLLAGLRTFKMLRKGDGSEIPLLVGISRKSMVYRLLGITPEESSTATQSLHMVALQNGTDILRVHDVAETMRTVKLYHTLSGCYKM